MKLYGKFRFLPDLKLQPVFCCQARASRLPQAALSAMFSWCQSEVLWFANSAPHFPVIHIWIFVSLCKLTEMINPHKYKCVCLPLLQQYDRSSKMWNLESCPVWVQGWPQQLLEQKQVSKVFFLATQIESTAPLCACLFYMRGWTGLRCGGSLGQWAAGSLVHRPHKALILPSSRRQQALVWLGCEHQSVSVKICGII